MTETPIPKATEPAAEPAGEHPHRYTARLGNEIERRWQRYWEEHRTFAATNPGDPGFDPAKPKLYCLDMFPYPSGEGLHIGHPLGYIATDIFCRYFRMRGFNVLHPMGFDAFGLPAEQYAVEHGVHPRVTTERNIANMKRQLKSLGLGYDWGRSFSTTDREYYRWTQWIFLQLYNSWYDPEQDRARPASDLDGLDEDRRRDILDRHRLAYMAEVPVNWCPALGTVLANEEVTNEGRSERGNHPVFKRPLRQWMLRITAYAKRLADDLDIVDWPEAIKQMQRNWIGRSEGALIEFPLDGRDEAVTVFTTRPDTVFGATYLVLAPEHALAGGIATGSHRARVERYRRDAAARSDVERLTEAGGGTKTGVFTGGFAINPATGGRIPVWIADYVLVGYGTGAIMAVPAHDLRDWVFARRFDLPVAKVVEPPRGHEPTSEEAALAAVEGGRTVYPFSGWGTSVRSSNDEVSLDGLPSEEAKKRITEWLEATGRGRSEVQYKLRDWLFSRQRYWGEPFPILHGPGGETVTIPESELPVELPQMEDFSPATSDDPAAPPHPPLSRAPDAWRIVKRGGVRYERELNTMPQWAGSCWYYLRYIDPRNAARMVGDRAERYWMGKRGVDLYVGGVEHAVLHLLYARFWHKVLYDLGHVSTPEPFGRLFNQGYIQAYAYRDGRGVAVPADQVVNADNVPAGQVQDQPSQRFFYNGRPVTQEYGKIGKSLKNVVSPDDINAQYGCDTLRLYEMYMGPLDASKPWNPRDIIGPFRFLQRVWRLAIDEETGALAVRGEADPAVERQLHRTIAKVQGDVERLAYNTAIASMIEFVNTATATGGLSRDQLERFVLVLAPFAPHLAEERWARLGHGESLAAGPWPVYDEALAAEDRVELPVQVQGKVRARIEVAADAGAEAIEAAALADPGVRDAIGNRAVRKVIVVPGRIVNVVLG